MGDYWKESFLKLKVEEMSSIVVHIYDKLSENPE